MDKPPAIEADIVQRFVEVAHKDLEATQEMLIRQPELINACWDWGGGDFETGLGGAAHMGSKDIARYLLDNGARIDIFAAAMLDMVDAVEAILKANPQAADALGPHGIPLIAHAKAGEAKGVIDLLS